MSRCLKLCTACAGMACVASHGRDSLPGEGVAEGRCRDGVARSGLQSDAGDKHRRHQAADRSYQGVSSQDVGCPLFTTRLSTTHVAALLHDQDPKRTPNDGGIRHASTRRAFS
jgi:hypothetical protein